jgi:hypothetical protein
MKYQTEKTPTKAVGMQDARNFHYQFNATMFKTLSEAYSDPIRAVIRELACNSSDAHQMAGNSSKPFELHLPTSHEPEFIIRDFGTGMDDQEINDLFTMYGGSNKRNNNEVIGALGIGSKSPYAVTTLYNVTSTKNGITRTYTATVEDKDGEGDMPVLLPGVVKETPNAPNGVTVQFSVPENRIWEYENKAKIALEFFAPEEYKINLRTFTPHKQSYVLKTDTWGLRREAKTAAHGYACRAIMGKVQYQIPSIDESRTNSIQKKILEMPLDLFFPLGSLSFAPSRETLKMNDKTTAAVLAVCDKVFEESLATVKAKIDACTDIWQAQILLFSLLNETNNTMSGGSGMSGLLREALEKGKLYGQYKNFTLSESKAIVNMLKYSHINVTKFEHNSGGRRGRTSSRAKKEPFIAIEPKTLREDKQIARATGDPLVISRNRFEITVKPDVLIVINDTDKPGDKYVHYHIQEANKGKNTVYMIHRNATDADLKKVVKNAKQLVADIGNAPVIMLSQLVSDYATIFAARRTSGSRGKSYQIAVLKSSQPDKIRRTQNGWAKAWRAPEDAEMDEKPKFYVEVEKRVPTNIPFSNVWDFNEFLTYVTASGKFGIERDTPIFAVRKGSKVTKSAGWVELFDHIYSRVNEIMTPSKTLSLSLHMTPFNDDCHELLTYLASKQPLSNSPAQMFACALAEAKGVRFDNWQSFKYVLNFCEGRGKYTPGLVVDFNEKWAEIKKGYPMLQFVDSYSVKSNIKTLVTYISQVDEQNFREALAAKSAAAASN